MSWLKITDKKGRTNTYKYLYGIYDVIISMNKPEDGQHIWPPKTEWLFEVKKYDRSMLKVKYTDDSGASVEDIQKIAVDMILETLKSAREKHKTIATRHLEGAEKFRNAYNALIQIRE